MIIKKQSEVSSNLFWNTFQLKNPNFNITNHFKFIEFPLNIIKKKHHINHLFFIVDVMEKTRPDGFCLLCSKADLDTNDFGCDEPIGLCGTCIINI